MRGLSEQSSVCCIVGFAVATLFACGGERDIDGHCANPACCDGNCSTASGGGHTGGGDAGGNSAGGGTTNIEQSFLDSYGDDAIQVGRDVAFDSEGDLYVAGFAEGTFPVGSEMYATDNLDLILFKVLAADGSVDWVKSFGQSRGSINTFAEVVVAVGADDNPLIASSLEGPTTLDANTIISPVGAGDELFIAKLDAASGDHLWYDQFGSGSSQQTIRGLATDSDGNVYLSGEVHGSGSPLPIGATTADHVGFACKLSSEGAAAWCTEMIGDNINLRSSSIDVADDGWVAVAGGFQGTLELAASFSIEANGSSFPDAYAVLIDPDGLVQRAARWGDSASQEASAVGFNSEGELVVAGRNSSTASFGAGIEAVATGDTDGFIAKIDRDMVGLWVVPIEGAAGKLVSGMAVGPDDSVSATGTFDTSFTLDELQTDSLGNRDIFVVSIDGSSGGNGALLWGRFFGGIGQQDAFGLDVADDGSVAFTGAMFGTVGSDGVTLTNDGLGEDIIVGVLAP